MQAQRQRRTEDKPEGVDAGNQDKVQITTAVRQVVDELGKRVGVSEDRGHVIPWPGRPCVYEAQVGAL